MVLLLVLLAGGVLFLGGSAPVTSTPIPAGQVRIHVEFEGISTEKFNELTTFVRALPKDYTDHPQADFNSQHGFGNNGFVTRTYRPNHPIPSADIEKVLIEQLHAFLKTNGLDGRGKLELRYGK